jgi:hypothetical protein
LVLLFLGQGPAVGSELPKTEDQLVATVQNALIDRDMSVFSKLVNWNQARPFRQRAVKAQISTAFGRPIRSVTLEAFPVDGLQEVEARGTLKANMNVSHQLRIVFDEPDNEFGTAPTDLFLVGRDQEGYRIALIVPVQTRGD